MTTILRISSGIQLYKYENQFTLVLSSTHRVDIGDGLMEAVAATLHELLLCMPWRVGPLCSRLGPFRSSSLPVLALLLLADVHGSGITCLRHFRPVLITREPVEPILHMGMQEVANGTLVVLLANIIIAKRIKSAGWLSEKT